MRTSLLIIFCLLIAGCRHESLKITNAKTSLSNGHTFTYAVEKVRGWNVMIEDTLWQEEQSQVQDVLSILNEKLTNIDTALPAPVVARLRTIPIYVTDTRSAPVSMHVHNSAGWLIAHGEDEQKVLALDICDPAKLRNDLAINPNAFLHNFALAYQGKFLTAKQRIELWDMHKAVLDSGKYGELPYGSSMRRSLSAASPTAYFGETSVAYWGHNQGYPVDRKDLKEYDPKMYEFLETVWLHPSEQ